MTNWRADAPSVEIDLDNDIALFEYTGGTTGLPTKAMLSHYSHIFKPSAVATICGFHENSRIPTTMPFFNIAGMLFRSPGPERCDQHNDYPV